MNEIVIMMGSNGIIIINGHDMGLSIVMGVSKNGCFTMENPI